MNDRRKKYSIYKNLKSDEYNKKPVIKGSIIVANLSDYEKLNRNVKDHKRESVVVLISKNKNLGVVYLHGLNDVNGKSRKYKEERGIWLKATKDNGEDVYVDLDIKDKDRYGNPIKQGDVFKNTNRYFNKNELNRIESHIFNPQKRKHSIRKIVLKNKKTSQ